VRCRVKWGLPKKRFVVTLICFIHYVMKPRPLAV
jgi:hypothetical protein